MIEPRINRLIHPLAIATAAATLLLIFMGGLVTSHGAGMSVPDWPNSYGYNMFAFPISQWRGGIFYEHTHRLMGSLVGFLSLLMFLHAWGYPKNLKALAIFSLTVVGLASILEVWAAVWPRGSFTAGSVVKYSLEFLLLVAAIGLYACACKKPDDRPWIRGLSLAVLLGVVFQGLLGGMRVVLVNLDLAIVHACVAQAFLCLATLLALLSGTSKIEKRTGSFALAAHSNAEVKFAEQSHREDRSNALPTSKNVERSHDGLSPALLAWMGCAVLVIYAQLMVGATMRHFQAGLAIPDLPLAYGHLLPSTSQTDLEAINWQRATGAFGVKLPPVTPAQIWLHFGHRCGAIVVSLVLGGAIVWILMAVSDKFIRRLAWTLCGLLLTQLTLGVLTVLWRKPADIASLHVAVGAATLMTTFILLVRAWPMARGVRTAEPSRNLNFELSPVTA